jgi:hypothetical protein
MAYHHRRRIGKRPFGSSHKLGGVSKPGGTVANKATPPSIPVAPGATPSALPAAPAGQCAKCHGSLEPAATFCGACGAPVKAGAKPKRTRLEVRRKIEKGRNLRQIRTGANTLLLLAVLNMAGCQIVYLMFQGDLQRVLALDSPETRAALADQGGNLAEFDRAVWVARHWGELCFAEFGLPALIFLGLYAWARSSPLPASVAGLITYLTIMIAGFALNPAALLSPVGWVVRILIIGALGSAIQSASAERRIAEREKSRKRAEDLARRSAASEQGVAEAAQESPV